MWIQIDLQSWPKSDHISPGMGSSPKVVKCHVKCGCVVKMWIHPHRRHVSTFSEATFSRLGQVQVQVQVASILMQGRGYAAQELECQPAFKS
jgi:hypothetical protein